MLSKKSYGGNLNHSGDFSNDVIFIDEGGTHEQNPFEGVLMGFDNEGTPNLVEEGEVIYNDYVFSNRLKPTKKLLEDGGFTDKYEDWTFAKIAEDMQKESSERPNDLISKQTLNDLFGRLTQMQEEVRMKKKQKENKFNLGGKVNKFFDGSDLFPFIEDSYNLDPTFVNDYFNYREYERLAEETQAAEELAKIEKDVLSKIVPSSLEDVGMSFLNSIGGAPNLKEIQDEINTQGDIFNNARSSALLRGESEEAAYKAGVNAMMSEGIKPTITDSNKFNWKNFGLDLTRVGAPLTAQFSALMNNLEEPDYSQNERSLNEARNAPISNIQVNTTDITPKKVDQNYIANMIRNQGNTLLSHYANMSDNAPQAMAYMMLANKQNQEQQADAYIKGDEANWTRGLQAAEFNRGNRQLESSTAFQNFANNAARHNAIVNETARAAAANAALDASRAQGIIESSGDIANTLSQYVTEKSWQDIIDKHPSLLYTSKGIYKNPTTIEAKNGGLLTKSKKRRK